MKPEDIKVGQIYKSRRTSLRVCTNSVDDLFIYFGPEDKKGMAGWGHTLKERFLEHYDLVYAIEGFEV